MANLGSDQLVEKLEEYGDGLNPLRDHLDKEKLEEITKALSGLQTDEGKVTADEHQALSELYLIYTEVEDQINSRYDEEEIDNFNSHTFSETVFVGLLRKLQEEKLGKSNSNPHKFPTVRDGKYHTEEDLSLNAIVKEIMARYPETPEKGREMGFNNDKRRMQYLEKFREKIKEWSDSSEHIEVKKSGAGWWPATPWVAALDSRTTTSTKEGVYVVFFIDPRQNKFYITLGQGTQGLKTGGRKKTKKEVLRERAEEIEGQLRNENFKTGEPDLTTESQRDEFYPPSTVLHKDWNWQSMPQDKESYINYTNLLQKYQKWLYSWEDPTNFIKYNPGSECYRFTGDPDHWITCIEKRAWGFNNEDISDLDEGDVIIFHSTGSTYTEDNELSSPSAGIIGVGIVERTGSKNENWWLGEHLDEESNWPKIVYFKKMFLTGDIGKLDLSRSTLNKYQENKEIINQEMHAVLENSLPVRSKASKIRQEMHGKAFPWNGSKSRFKYEEGEGDYDREYPKRLIEEMMIQ